MMALHLLRVYAFVEGTSGLQRRYRCGLSWQICGGKLVVLWLMDIKPTNSISTGIPPQIVRSTTKSLHSVDKLVVDIDPLFRFVCAIVRRLMHKCQEMWLFTILLLAFFGP